MWSRRLSGRVMFSLFRKKPIFSLEAFREFRLANPEQDHVLALLICKPILMMGEFMKSEFWSDERQFKDLNEHVDVVLHYTPKQASQNAIIQAENSHKKRPKTKTSEMAYLFTKEFWTESLGFPSFGNGGKADFSVLNEAKTAHFISLQSEFVSLAGVLNKSTESEL